MMRVISFCPDKRKGAPEPSGAPFASAIKAIDQILIDRKSTRLNSSHVRISYAVFCLKKKSTSSLSPAAASPCRLISSFNPTTTPDVYTLSLHDALPILVTGAAPCNDAGHFLLSG